MSVVNQYEALKKFQMGVMAISPDEKCIGAPAGCVPYRSGINGVSREVDTLPELYAAGEAFIGQANHSYFLVAIYRGKLFIYAHTAKRACELFSWARCAVSPGVGEANTQKGTRPPQGITKV